MNVFDGKQAAQSLETALAAQIKQKGKTSHAVSFVVGDEKGAKFYQSLKQKAAERIGAQLEIVHLPPETSKEDLVSRIQKANADTSTSGVMVQLPLPKNFTPEATREIVDTISLEKDIDGMKEESPFLAPVVEAVLLALDAAIKEIPHPKEILVVGSKGFVGKRVVLALQKKYTFTVRSVDQGDDLVTHAKNADIIISTTGVEGVIRKDMVKEGVGLIDVGYPAGDIEKGAYQKATFVSPVPGGVGPLTISFLMKHLVESGH